MPTTESITLVERYGSFGLLVIIVLATMAGVAVFVRYLKNELLPKVFAHLEAERAEREKMCETSDRTVARNTEAVAELANEVRKLKDRTDEHRPYRRPSAVEDE